MHIEVPYVALLLGIMLMAVAMILQTFHFSNRIGNLEAKVAELAKLIGGAATPAPPK